MDTDNCRLQESCRRCDHGATHRGEGFDRPAGEANMGWSPGPVLLMVFEAEEAVCGLISSREVRGSELSGDDMLREGSV